jgi:hypothetical protein
VPNALCIWLRLNNDSNLMALVSLAALRLCDDVVQCAA